MIVKPLPIKYGKILKIFSFVIDKGIILRDNCKNSTIKEMI